MLVVGAVRGLFWGPAEQLRRMFAAPGMTDRGQVACKGGYGETNEFE